MLSPQADITVKDKAILILKTPTMPDASYLPTA